MRAAALALCGLWLAVGAAALEPGDPAPSFRAASLEGDSTLALESYRGKLVYLDFWASWCAPCAASLPVLDALQREFGGRDFEVLAVNVDRDPGKAQAFLRKRPVGYPSVSDPEGELPEQFGLETMPTSYLIDREGVIRYVHRGFREGDEEVLREQIRRLLRSAR